MQRALEALGKSMIEADVFRWNRVKKGKRIKYLQLVLDCTGIQSINPTVDQRELLVHEGRFGLRCWYIATFVFGLAGTLWFYRLELH